MKVILDEKIYNDIWNKVDNTFKFKPSMDINVNPFEFDVNYKSYHLNTVWTEEQEKIVNDIFREISNDDIYALDWQHDCFEFNPQEKIPLDYQYHDDDRNVEVYFPSYYPNGDYHFFISKDFSYGLLGHPWKKEIYVFGNELINKIDNKIEELELLNNSDDNKTLLELCKITEDKTNFESYVVQTSEAAIRKPLKELSNEETRLLISQKIGLKYLLPKALHILENNILTDCQYYNGDLFETLLRLNEEDWKNNDINAFVSIINKSFKELEKLRDETKDEYNIELFNKTQEFLQKYKDN